MATRTICENAKTSFTVDGEFSASVVRNIMDMTMKFKPVELRFIQGMVNTDETKQLVVSVQGPAKQTAKLEANLKAAFGKEKVMAVGGV